VKMRFSRKARGHFSIPEKKILENTAPKGDAEGAQNSSRRLSREEIERLSLGERGGTDWEETRRAVTLLRNDLKFGGR